MTFESYSHVHVFAAECSIVLFSKSYLELNRKLCAFLVVTKIEG